MAKMPHGSRPNGSWWKNRAWWKMNEYCEYELFPSRNRIVQHILDEYENLTRDSIFPLSDQMAQLNTFESITRYFFAFVQWEP